MKHLVEEAHLSDRFEIASAATSTEELGNPVYPPAKRKLAEHGIRCDGHHARQLTRNDYDRYDLLIGMDHYNLRNMTRMCGGDPEGKIHLLMEYPAGRQGNGGSLPHPLRKEGCPPSFGGVLCKTSDLGSLEPCEKSQQAGARGGWHDTEAQVCPDVADPWYTGNFDATWRDCLNGCRALLDLLQQPFHGTK